MAGIDEGEALVGIDGVVATGVRGTAVAPTSATADLGITWTDQGLVTDAGVSRSEEVTPEVMRAWQRNRKVRSTVTESAVRWEFVLMQTNPDSVELFHGVPIEADGSVIVDLTSERPRIAFLIDVIDEVAGVENVVREYAPNAQVVEVGAQVAVAGGNFGWPVTIEADYDETLGGHTRRFFSAFAP